MDIGFLSIRFWDVLDVIIVGYLLYQSYRLLKGSIGYNIFIGVVLLYLSWWVVGRLQMELLGSLLDQFVSIGVVILIIIFQPEVRRFLLFLGDSTIRQRSQFFSRLIERSQSDKSSNALVIEQMSKAILQMGKKRIGALIILNKGVSPQLIGDGGVSIQASISDPLLRSIFNKDSPLHDGAVVIANSKIVFASRILPVSDNKKLPQQAGLRHRAAVGITERIDVAAIIVSEETGKISLSYKGELQMGLDEEQLQNTLKTHLK